MTKSYNKSFSVHKVNNFISLCAAIALVLILAVSFWALNGFIKGIITGEKENLRSTLFNFFVLDYENTKPENESNDTYEEANKIELNAEYRGNLDDTFKNGEQDWYFFSIPEGGEIRCTVNTIDQKDEESYWNLKFRSADDPDEIIMNENIAGNCTKYKSPSYYLSAGDYYFEIESSNKYSSDPYGFIINYDPMLDKYVGTYELENGPGIIRLDLFTKILYNGRIEALFSFSPHSTNPDIPSGRFRMEGRVVEYVSSNDYIKIELNGTEWIDQPENYSMIGFTAFLNKSTGIITSYECGMNLIREDLLNINDLYENAKKYEFNGHKYGFIPKAVSWGDAETICNALGGHLVSINSSEEQDFVQGIADENEADNIWIGGYFDDEAWKWTDESEFTYSNWDKDKPDESFGREKYIKFSREDIKTENSEVHRGKWDNVHIMADGMEGDAPLSSFGFICEWTE